MTADFFPVELELIAGLLSLDAVVCDLCLLLLPLSLQYTNGITVAIDQIWRRQR